ncbi:uncharacterized protein BJ171DRAFT_636549 [Polychytrium aggregatum]|uniref:uncharacterized protein n=1 Tax=Polychytrium aggregatum TaxID=110093 RepID=UPI0022FE7B56|nr:uncharacterized protein BJ171DRAFT_636549 [Polychytrium aggregatum]KAI9208040.1 hypothetical protein BJ171DRAFT_636549 [Polychytrium aggregatum]
MAKKAKAGAGKKKGKDGKKKGKKKHAKSSDDSKITNSKGELVSGKEYLLEHKLEAASRSLLSYKERVEGLVNANENLQETCQQQERDALEVISALNKESDTRHLKALELTQILALEKEKAKAEKDAIVVDCERRLEEMENVVNEKEAAFKVMQQEFSVIKDFRKKRHELLRELELQKVELSDAEKRHKDTVARLERKFFEEKIRLQKEANKKISELATRAHNEAVANLKETTKDVYKENQRMAAALRSHVQEGEELAKQNAELKEHNRQLCEDRDMHNVIVKEKISQTRQQMEEIFQLNKKIQSMEHSLSHVVREFEHEREIIGKLARRELEEVKKSARRLKENLARKTQEMKHIKAFQSFRPTRHPDDPVSAASALLNEADDPAYRDIEGNPKKVDITDLKWFDKERVLRLLFAKMNGVTLEDARRPEMDPRLNQRFKRSSSSSEFVGYQGEDRLVDIEGGASNLGMNASSPPLDGDPDGQGLWTSPSKALPVKGGVVLPPVYGKAIGSKDDPEDENPVTSMAGAAELENAIPSSDPQPVQ